MNYNTTIIRYTIKTDDFKNSSSTIFSFFFYFQKTIQMKKIFYWFQDLFINLLIRRLSAVLYSPFKSSILLEEERLFI